MEKEQIAFFDVDHTIIRGVSAIAFLRVCISHRLIRSYYLLPVPFLYVCYRLFHVKIDVLYCLAVKLLKGYTRNDFLQISHEAYCKYMKKKLYRKIVEEIQRLHQMGVHVKIATSAPTEFVADIATECGIDTTDIIATAFEYDSNGVFTGRLIGKPAFSENKQIMTAAFLNRINVKPELCSFYSDSVHDLPLLGYVGRPVAVCPDFKLYLIAKMQKWEIIKGK